MAVQVPRAEGRGWRRLLRPDLLAVLVGLGAWELVGRMLDGGDRLTPFTTVVSTAVRMLSDGEFNDMFSTIGLFAAGVGLSIVLAVATAAAMSGSRAISLLLRPYLYAFLAIPPLALVPIFMLLWGPTDGARIVAVMCFAYFPMAVSFAEAVEDAPAEAIEMARSFGASPLRLYFLVLLPSVATRLVAGVRIGAVRGLKGSVTAEVVMGGVGLGGLLRTYSAGFRLPELYATVLMVVLVSLIVYAGVHALEAHAERRMG